MKKIYAIMLVGLISVLSACGSTETTAPDLSHIEPANLSEQEADIANLFMDHGKDYVFDFTADKNVQSVRFQVDELQNGKWVKKASNGGLGFMETEKEKENIGRILLNLDTLAKDGSLVVLHDGSRIELNVKAEELADADMQTGSMMPLSDKVDIEYEKEIPLFIEFWDKDSVSMPTADPFENPQAFADTGCEHIYMVTAIFSQKPIGED